MALPHYLCRKVDILESILLHTLLQEDLALITRRRSKKFLRMNLLDIPRNPHNIHIRPTQLANITQLFHDILLGMNTVIRITRSATPRTIPVMRSCQNLPPHDNHRHMDTIPLPITIRQVHRPRIREELLQDRSTVAMDVRHYIA